VWFFLSPPDRALACDLSVILGGQLLEISCLGSDFGLGRSRQGGGKGSLGRVEVRFRRFMTEEANPSLQRERGASLKVVKPMGRGPGEGRGAFSAVS
jgi:hypothetical protein